MPDTVREDPGTAECDRSASLDEMDTFGLYESGTKVTEQPEILFARQDLKEVLEKRREAPCGTGGCRRQHRLEDGRKEEEETGHRHRAEGRDHL